MLEKTPRSGFTLVELSMSIAFISVLAITIAVMTVNLINSYQRGVTLKELNTISMELIDDLRSAISNSSAKSVSEICKTFYDSSSNNQSREYCEKNNAYSFVYFVHREDVNVADNSISGMPVWGGFCSGTYSYIWNSGYFFDSADEYMVGNNAVGELSSLSFKYKDQNGELHSIDSFRLLKILDPSRSVCVAATTNSNSPNIYPVHDIKDHTNSIDVTDFGPLMEEPTDLLLNGNSQNFALYNLYIDNPAQDSQSRNLLYTGSFILATIQGGINIKAEGNYCATPDSYVSNFNYCAINKFNFAARATGE